MKQLTLTLYIDPGAAVRAGRSQVGEATVTLSDADLSKLTAQQLLTLAKHVSGEYYPELGTPGYSAGAVRYRDPLHQHAGPISDVSIETIAELLDHREKLIQQQSEEIAQKQEQQRKVVDAEALAAIHNPEKVKRRLDREGNWTTKGPGFFEIEVLKIQYPYIGDCSEAVQTSYRSEKELLEREAEKLRSFTVTSGIFQAKLAKEAEEKAAHEAAYAAEYAKLPELLRERYEAGFASEEEVEKALQQRFVEQAGYLPIDAWLESHGLTEDDHTIEDLETLTDEEFVTFKAIREKAPEGAGCNPQLICNSSQYRKATEDDDPDDIDRDGEVRLTLEERNPHRVVIITWTRVGIECAAIESLS